MKSSFKNIQPIKVHLTRRKFVFLAMGKFLIACMPTKHSRDMSEDKKITLAGFGSGLFGRGAYGE